MDDCRTKFRLLDKERNNWQSHSLKRQGTETKILKKETRYLNKIHRLKVNDVYKVEIRSA